MLWVAMYLYSILLSLEMGKAQRFLECININQGVLVYLKASYMYRIMNQENSGFLSQVVSR